MVWDKEYRIAGSIDMTFVNEDGSIDIYDWKRSKEIVKVSGYNKWMNLDCLSHLPDTNFWHYSLQLNIYKAIIEQKYNKTVIGLYLVCLHPNNKNGSYQRIQCADLSAEVAQLFAERYREVNNFD